MVICIIRIFERNTKIVILNNNNNKDFIYRGGHVTAEKLTNLWPSN